MARTYAITDDLMLLQYFKIIIKKLTNAINHFTYDDMKLIIKRLCVLTTVAIGFKFAMNKVTQSSFELAQSGSGGSCNTAGEGSLGTVGE
jgi:hypothetical protein